MCRTFALAIALGTLALGEEPAWVPLSGDVGLSAFRPPTAAWFDAGGAALDPKNPRKLVGTEGRGTLVNGPTGLTTNIVTKESFGDVEFRGEFLVPKGSNAGVKLMGLYEIQILDSYGKTRATASDCGGIYPRAELLPKYHHIDEGYPPKLNACRPPGEWQSLEITFRAPRFDEAGKKVADAEFVKVVLNGQVVHEGRKVPCPTGHAYRQKEVARGPILLQADHGPVAFRGLTVRAL